MAQEDARIEESAIRHDSTSVWLPLNRKSRPTCRWFCFPHAGGGSSLFHRWAKEVPPEIDVLPIRLPGREDRLHERPMDSLRELVEVVGPVIAEETITGSPFVLVGNSLGGKVAFELSRWLRRQCRRMPLLLVVAGSRAPHLPPHGGFREPWALAPGFAGNAEGLRNPGLAPTAHEKAMSELNDAEFLSEMQKRFGIGTAHAELMRFLLPTLRADVRMLETYEFQPEPPLDVPILALGGQDDGEVTAADIAGWREHTVQFSQRTFPGGHFFFESSARSVVQAIARRGP